MLDVESINHIEIRVRDKSHAVSFYENLESRVIQDAGFDKGYPVIMKPASGTVLNLLGPANTSAGPNILMDVDDKYPPGYTHIAMPFIFLILKTRPR